MSENLVMCARTVLPLALLTALGYCLKRTRFFDEDFVGHAEKLCFQVTLPCGVFVNFLSISLRQNTSGGVVPFLLASITVFTLILMAVVPRIVRDNAKAAAMIQGMFRTNCLVQAVPMLENLYGEGNAELGILCLPFVVMLNNILATVIFAVLGNQKGGHGWAAWLKTGGKILKNPLILGCIAGAACSLAGITVPAVLADTLRQLNRMGSALILLCMGARLHVQGLGARLHDTLPTVAVRLIVMPAAVTALAVLLGFRGQALATVFLYISTSSASVGYIMAASMGADGDIAAESICLSSIFSVATVTAGLLLLAHMGWIP